MLGEGQAITVLREYPNLLSVHWEIRSSPASFELPLQSLPFLASDQTGCMQLAASLED